MDKLDIANEIAPARAEIEHSIVRRGITAEATSLLEQECLARARRADLVAVLWTLIEDCAYEAAHEAGAEVAGDAAEGAGEAPEMPAALYARVLAYVGQSEIEIDAGDVPRKIERAIREAFAFGYRAAYAERWDEQALLDAGRALTGAEPIGNGMWRHYDSAARAWFVVDADALREAGRMNNAGEFDYSRWCASTDSEQLSDDDADDDA